MKTKECIRLAKNSIKSHPKQTRNIIVGFAFSLTLLVLVGFIFLGFNLGVTSAFVKNEVLTSFNIYYGDSGDINSQINYEYSSMHEEMEGVEDYINYKRIYMPYSSLEFYVEEEQHFLQDTTDYMGRSMYEYIDFIDLEKSTGAFTNAEEKYLKDMKYGNAILEGEPLSENVNEILISSSAVERLGLIANEVIGKSITVKMNLQNKIYSIFDSEGEAYGEALLGESVNLFEDYIIAGVFNSRIYDSHSRSGYSNSAMFLFNINSLYDSSSNYYFPEINEGEVVYEKTLEEYHTSAMADGKVFFPNGFNNNRIKKQEFNSIIQFQSLNKEIEALSVLGYYIEQTILPDTNFSLNMWMENICSSEFCNYYETIPFIRFISLAILIVSSVVFAVTLLNLYNYSKYSIDNRRSYFGMLKAVGLNKKSINKLYFIEISFMSILGLLISFVFSLTGAIVLTIVINDKIAIVENVFSVKFEINLLYYFLSFLSFGLLILGYSFLMSYFLCRNVSKTKIIELLKM